MSSLISKSGHHRTLQTQKPHYFDERKPKTKKGWKKKPHTHTHPTSASPPQTLLRTYVVSNAHLEKKRRKKRRERTKSTTVSIFCCCCCLNVHNSLTPKSRTHSLACTQCKGGLEYVTQGNDRAQPRELSTPHSNGNDHSYWVSLHTSLDRRNFKLHGHQVKGIFFFKEKKRVMAMVGQFGGQVKGMKVFKVNAIL